MDSSSPGQAPQSSFYQHHSVSRDGNRAPQRASPYTIHPNYSISNPPFHFPNNANASLHPLASSSHPTANHGYAPVSGHAYHQPVPFPSHSNQHNFHPSQYNAPSSSSASISTSTSHYPIPSHLAQMQGGSSPYRVLSYNPSVSGSPGYPVGRNQYSHPPYFGPSNQYPNQPASYYSETHHYQEQNHYQNPSNHYPQYPNHYQPSDQFNKSGSGEMQSELEGLSLGGNYRSGQNPSPSTTGTPGSRTFPSGFNSPTSLGLTSPVQAQMGIASSSPELLFSMDEDSNSSSTTPSGDRRSMTGTSAPSNSTTSRQLQNVLGINNMDPGDSRNGKNFDPEMVFNGIDSDPPSATSIQSNSERSNPNLHRALGQSQNFSSSGRTMTNSTLASPSIPSPSQDQNLSYGIRNSASHHGRASGNLTFPTSFRSTQNPLQSPHSNGATFIPFGSSSASSSPITKRNQFKGQSLSVGSNSPFGMVDFTAEETLLPDGSRRVQLVSEELRWAIKSGKLEPPPPRYYVLPPHAGSSHEKPKATYLELIGAAILSASNSSLSSAEICNWITATYPFFKPGDYLHLWEKSVNSTLSTQNCFAKRNRDRQNPGKGGLWTIPEQFVGRFIKEYAGKDQTQIQARSNGSTSTTLSSGFPSSSPTTPTTRRDRVISESGSGVSIAPTKRRGHSISSSRKEGVENLPRDQFAIQAGGGNPNHSLVDSSSDEHSYPNSHQKRSNPITSSSYSIPPSSGAVMSSSIRSVNLSNSTSNPTSTATSIRSTATPSEQILLDPTHFDLTHFDPTMFDSNLFDSSLFTPSDLEQLLPRQQFSNPFPNKSLPNKSLPDESLPTKPLPKKTLPSKPLPAKPLPVKPLPNEYYSNPLLANLYYANPQFLKDRMNNPILISQLPKISNLQSGEYLDQAEKFLDLEREDLTALDEEILRKLGKRNQEDVLGVGEVEQVGKSVRLSSNKFANIKTPDVCKTCKGWRCKKCGCLNEKVEVDDLHYIHHLLSCSKISLISCHCGRNDISLVGFSLHLSTHKDEKFASANIKIADQAERVKSFLYSHCKFLLSLGQFPISPALLALASRLQSLSKSPSQSQPEPQPQLQLQSVHQSQSQSQSQSLFDQYQFESHPGFQYQYQWTSKDSGCFKKNRLRSYEQFEKCHYNGCYHRFVEKIDLSIHLVDVHGENISIPKMKCKWTGCESSCRSQLEFKNHLRDKHVDNQRPPAYKCQWDNCKIKGSADKSFVRSHVLAHAPEFD